MTITSPIIAIWTLVLVNLIWGVGFVVVDDVVEMLPVNTFNAFRFGFASLALLPLLFLEQIKARTTTCYKARYNISSLFKAGFSLGLLLFLGFSLQTQGLLYTSVSNTGFITGMCVPLVPIFGYLFFKNKVGQEVWLSVIMASLGLYFLTVGENLVLNKGDILVGLSAICYAAHITFMAKYGGRYQVVALSLVQLIAVTLYSVIAAVGESSLIMNAHYPVLFEQLQKANVWWAIMYSAILASAFAFWVQTSSQRLIEPHTVAIIFALEPIFGHLAAFFLLGEHMGFQGWLGAAMIIAGMLYAELGGRRKAKMQALDQISAPLD